MTTLDLQKFWPKKEVDLLILMSLFLFYDCEAVKSYKKPLKLYKIVHFMSLHDSSWLLIP